MAERPELETRRGGSGHRRQAVRLLKVSVGAALLIGAIFFAYHLKKGTTADEPGPLVLGAVLLLAPFAATMPVIVVLLLYGLIADRRFAAGRCPRCGYDVGSVQAGVDGERRGAKCPQCGAGV